MNSAILKTWLVISIVLFVSEVQSAEYSDGDIIPEVTSILFTRDSVALTVQLYVYVIGETDLIRYFKADRGSLEFRQIDREQFDNLLGEDHFQDYASLYEELQFAVTEPEVDACRNHADPEVACRASTTKQMEIEGRTYNVEMLTTSSISDGKVIDGELWLATYEQGGHGEYSAEGVLIVSSHDTVPQRIDVGYGVAKGIAVDPWSTNIWIVTGWQLALVSEGKRVTRRYWPFHDMSKTLNRPGVFVQSSNEPIISNPLAIFAYSLGERSYEAFATAAKEGIDLYDPNPLYNFFMFGSFTHRPQLPEQLIPVLDFAEPTYSWRKFACMLPGGRAKQLCELELDAWPARVD